MLAERLFSNGLAEVKRSKSLILALEFPKSGAEGAVNSKSKSNPLAGFRELLVSIPGLFPGETVPAPVIVGTVPEPVRLALDLSVSVDDVAMLPEMFRVPSCAQVGPEFLRVT